MQPTHELTEEETKYAHPQPFLEPLLELCLLTTPRLRYLGGDIQHTHLVKGLDMSLLAKVPPNQTVFSL